MATVNIDPPPVSELFSGELLRDKLEDRYLAGIAAVYRLEPAAFGPGLDPAAAIMGAIDVQPTAIDWDTPTRVDGVTRDQKRITIVSYPVTGDARSLTWLPTTRQLGSPPARYGLAQNRLTIVSIGRTLDEDTITAAAVRVRRHVDTNRSHQALELTTWRTDTARRIRDAVNTRRPLLSAIPESGTANAPE